MVRPALLGESYGKLALLGGYQMLGQAWQEARRRRCWKTRALWSAMPHVESSRWKLSGSTAESALLPEPAIAHEGAFVHIAEDS
jgi:hypothetical protein